MTYNETTCRILAVLGIPGYRAISFTVRKSAMPDPSRSHGAERRLVSADTVARNNESLEQRLEAVDPMSIEHWESLAIEDLSDDEAEVFWQAVAG